MSTSCIEFKENYFWENDNLIVIVCYYFIENFDKKDSPKWFSEYMKEVIEYTHDLKPVGYADMELDETFFDDKRKSYFIKFIDNVVSQMEKSTKNKYINVEKLNEILRMQETEGYELANSIVKFSTIIEIIKRIKKTLLNIDTGSESPAHCWQ